MNGKWIWPLVAAIIVLVFGGWIGTNTVIGLRASTRANDATTTATSTKDVLLLRFDALAAKVETMRKENRADHKALDDKIETRHMP